MKANLVGITLPGLVSTIPATIGEKNIVNFEGIHYKVITTFLPETLRRKSISTEASGTKILKIPQQAFILEAFKSIGSYGKVSFTQNQVIRYIALNWEVLKEEVKSLHLICTIEQVYSLWSFSIDKDMDMFTVTILPIFEAKKVTSTTDFGVLVIPK